ncbi:MAG: N-acetylneuraminate synthase family protein, partial [Leeuwenhoekiella sp.]
IGIAKKLIEEAKKAGADCIKFQTFKAKQIVTQDSPKAAYQLKVTDRAETQFEMLKKLELDMSAYGELVAYCQELSIDFLSTPYNKEDVDFLLKFDVNAFKIASGQLTEIPFLKYVAKTGKRVILSTGMGTLADVFNAVEAIRSTGNNDLIALQCTTNYPSKIEDANIRAMQGMRDACKVQVGYSDHVANNYACYAAVALGAELIEKHFTIDRTMEGPDHSSSLIPSEFKEMVDGIRNIELALGSSVKRPSEIEIQNSLGMKRGMVVLDDIAAGTVLTEDLIGFKRPLKGIPINMLHDVIGKKITRSMKADESLDYNCIAW